MDYGSIAVLCVCRSCNGLGAMSKERQVVCSCGHGQQLFVARFGPSGLGRMKAKIQFRHASYDQFVVKRVCLVLSSVLPVL